MPRTARYALLRLGGVTAGTRAISSGVRFTGPGITIGRRTFLNTGTLLDASAAICIGDDVAVGPRVTILTATHDVGPAGRRAGALRALPVVVGNGCWIGAGVTILPGVTIGPGCIIAAGAVVIHDCGSAGTYVGVPARRAAA